MKRTDFLDRKIERYLRKGQIFKGGEYTTLEKPFLAKSRKNLTVANLVLNYHWSIDQWDVHVGSPII